MQIVFAQPLERFDRLLQFVLGLLRVELSDGSTELHCEIGNRFLFTDKITHRPAIQSSHLYQFIRPRAPLALFQSGNCGTGEAQGIGYLLLRKTACFASLLQTPSQSRGWDGVD